MEEYFAHGKLLLSAEYAILYGAKGIALPLKKGQELKVFKEPKKGKKSVVKWTAFDQNNYPWFEAKFKTEDKSIIKCTYKGAANTLQTLLSLVPDSFFDQDLDYRFETYLQFDNSWGWGTSSTLVSLIAQCTGADPYQMYQQTFKGSGFDLACATAKDPILYSLDNSGEPITEPIEFSPSFKENIFFVYLGKKQNSLNSIKSKDKPDDSFLEKVTQITAELVASQTNQKDFCSLLEEHEMLLSSYLKKETIKQQLFPNIKATVKSLGAWGGDFVMMVGNEEEIYSLKDSGYSTIFGWDEIVL